MGEGDDGGEGRKGVGGRKVKKDLIPGQNKKRSGSNAVLIGQLSAV